MSVAEQRELITVEQAAARFNRAIHVVRYWYTSGKIQKYENELDKRTYVDAREIERKLQIRPVDDDPA